MKKCLRREIAKLSVRFMYSLQFKLLETRRKNKGCLGEQLFADIETFHRWKLLTRLKYLGNQETLQSRHSSWKIRSIFHLIYFLLMMALIADATTLLE